MTAQETSPRIDVFGITDVGKVRELNEDQFVIASLRKAVEISHSSLAAPTVGRRIGGAEAHLFVVADGVGGRPGGELASGSAVAALLEYVDEAVVCYHSLDVDQEHDFLGRLEDSVHQAHRRLLEQHGPDGKGPATTLTMITLCWPRAYVVHVGDSRAYYFRGGRLRQLTRDQTMGEYMVDVGAWTDEQAARAKAAAHLTSALGGSEMTPSVGLVDLEPGDILLLCTDGLSKFVAEEQIVTVLRHRASAEDICRELLRAALDAGGDDNITLIVARTAG
jgi:protein phosphatase